MRLLKSVLVQVGKATNHERVPRWGSRITLCKKEGSKCMIATLDLEKLDWISNRKRHCRFIKDLYVVPSEDVEHFATTVEVYTAGFSHVVNALW